MSKSRSGSGMARDTPRVSVVVRVRTSDDNVLHLLKKLARQTLAPCEFMVIDSGSAPRIVERLKEIAKSGLNELDRQIPVTLTLIPAHTFHFARTLNQGVAQTIGELVAIISADALPADEHYLKTLADLFDDNRIAAAYARQVLPPGARHVAAKDLGSVYPQESRIQEAPDSYFSNACSMIRRSLWEEHSFNEWILAAEDHEWARWAQSQGYLVAYQGDVAVYHLHEVGHLHRIWKRYYREGHGLGYLRGRPLPLRRAWRDFRAEVAGDRHWQIDEGYSCFRLLGKRVPPAWFPWIARRATKHLAQFVGFFSGARAYRLHGDWPPVQMGAPSTMAIICGYQVDLDESYTRYLSEVALFLREHSVEHVIVSGGTTGPDSTCSVAEAAGRYLRERYPTMNVFLETRSLTTLHNLLFSECMIRDGGTKPSSIYVCCDRARAFKARALSWIVLRSYHDVKVRKFNRVEPLFVYLLQLPSTVLQCMGAVLPPLEWAIHRVKLVTAWRRQRKTAGTTTV